MSTSNIRVLTAPEIHMSQTEIHSYPIRIFLAGGISNCPNWQEQAIYLLDQAREWGPNELLIINPRSPTFSLEASSEDIQAQVGWEYHHLTFSTNLFWFWFPAETVCPITLYELGRQTKNKGNNLIVGCHPNYPRLQTLKTQLALARSEVQIVSCLEDLVNQVLAKTR